MNRTRALLLIVILLFVSIPLAHAQDGGEKTRFSPVGLPPPGEMGDEDATVILQNGSPFDIGGFFLSPTESETWGENYIGSDEEILRPGARREFTVPPGAYDIQARDIYGNILSEDWHRLFYSGMTSTFYINVVRIEVVNRTGQKIHGLLLPETNWAYMISGSNRLYSEEVLQPGAKRFVYTPRGVTFDLIAVDMDYQIISFRTGESLTTNTTLNLYPY